MRNIFEIVESLESSMKNKCIANRKLRDLFFIVDFLSKIEHNLWKEKQNLQFQLQKYVRNNKIKITVSI